MRWLMLFLNPDSLFFKKSAVVTSSPCVGHSEVQQGQVQGPTAGSGQFTERSEKA